MSKSKMSVALVTSTLLFLPSCSEDMSVQEKGELIGLALGTAVGFAIGDDLGIGEGVGSVVGAMAGTMIGGVIGQKLDEVDRLKMEVATLSALQMDEEATVLWKSDKNENVLGTVSTRNVSRPSQRDCRVVTHTVNIRGQESLERDTLCRQADGSWALS